MWDHVNITNCFFKSKVVDVVDEKLEARDDETPEVVEQGSGDAGDRGTFDSVLEADEESLFF